MGAYLSQPKTDKVSIDEANELLTVGASSMQGWRNSQEDAHNAILDFDTQTSFFAVYDGHGGAEVATYCADNLPQFLKELSSYQKGKFEEALKDAFLSFDQTLLESRVVQILKILAGEKNVADPDDSDAVDGDEDVEDLAELHEESHLPLSEVLEKYKGLSMPILKHVKESSSSGSKPQSPFLRGRRAAAVAADAANKAVMDPDAHPQGSSTSAAAKAAASSLDDAGAGCSKSLSNISKMETDQEPEEDSTVSSSSSSGSKSNNNSIIVNANTNASPSANDSTATAEAEADTEAEAIPKKITTNGTSAEASNAAVNTHSTAPDSSHVKESEQNGSVTSSETKEKIKADVSTSTPAKTSAKSITDDSTVSGSSDAVEGKQNGSIGSTSSNDISGGGGGDADKAKKTAAGTSAAISSTSKASKKPKKSLATGDDDSTDDDADYDAENSSADELEAIRFGYSSSEELEGEDDEAAVDGDDDGEEDADDDDDDEDEDDDEEEDEDEESALANEQFCANMIEEPGKDSGCTAVVAVLNGRDLYVANAGDSRCVVCRDGKAIEMSLDHKPEDDEESARIIKAGGRVTLDGRVNGGLNLSRAIGDHAYKLNFDLKPEEQMISALPDIKKLIITPQDEFMILACDGIWNYMSSEEVVDFVRLRLKDRGTDISNRVSQICEELFDNCLAPNTMGDGTGCDNMTAVIVCFQPKLLELPTKICSSETEDVLAAKRAAEADAADVSLQKSLKRCASPNAANENDENSNEAEHANKTKRLKTDGEAGESTSSTNTINNNNTSSSSGNSGSDACSSAAVHSSGVVSDSSGDSTSVVMGAEQKECDSVGAAMDTTSTSSNSEASAVSST